VVGLGLLSGADFERLVDPREMLGPSEGGVRGAPGG
jgi:hypothetical protein